MRLNSIMVIKKYGFILGFFSGQFIDFHTAKADASFTGGLGVAVHSNGVYSPLVDVSLGGEKWKFNANVSGYSESKTQVTHLLAGALYTAPLTSGRALSVEAGLGALMAQTRVNSESERMFSVAVPLGINWTIARTSVFVVEANWKSWLFSQPTYLPPLVVLSHDRFTTLTMSAGVAL
ncbi:MAG: hypothetical protein ACO3A4_09560 [Silvanigrellaceae bacterium]